MSQSALLLLRVFTMAVCINICCDLFPRGRVVAFTAFPAIGTCYHTVSNKNICPIIARQSLIRKTCNKACSWTHQKLTMTNGDVEINQSSRFSWLRFPILERSHEKIIYLVFGGISASILQFAHIHSRADGLPPLQPGKWLTMAETGLALLWSSMIIAISFLEAWTKFRAPFLKKYIAVDVGRHVFAALNAAELGLASSFWMHRMFLCYQVRSMVGGGLLHKGRSYYEQFTFVLPAAATFSLLYQVFFVAPKLYRRAKRRILDGFDDALPSVKISMSKEEQAALMDIARDFRQSKKLPSRIWHSFYALLEIIKMSCLNAFVVLSWLKVLT